MHAEELQRRLDLLADEELSPAEERELLAQLDQVPGGWRRCALALLEARSWQRALHDWPVGAPSEPPTPSSSQPPPSPAEPPRRSPWHLRESVAWAVVAVSLLVVGFVLGRQFVWPGGDAGRGPAPLVAQQPKGLPVPGGSGTQAVAVREKAPHAPRRQPRGLAPPDSGPATVPHGLWGWQEVTPEGRLVRRVVAAPPAEGVDGPALRPEDVFPPQWLRTLQMLGHRIQVRQHWHSVPAADGTEVLLPQYEIHVVPVRRSGIQ